jgi:hypothetical protein
MPDKIGRHQMYPQIFWRSAVWTFLGLAAAWTSSLILKNAVSIPFQDDWNFAHIYIMIKNRSLGIGDLTRQFNDHRLFVPLAIMSTNAVLLGWKIKINLLINVVIATATAAMLIKFVYRTLEDRGFVSGLTCVLVTAQVFNMAQYVNWLWEWDMSWFLVNLFTVACMLSLFKASTEASQNIHVAASILCAFLASFSFGNGPLLWPVGLFYIVLEPRLRKFSAIWLLAAVSTVLLFLYGYRFAASSFVADMSPAHRAFLTLEFLSRYFGSTLDGHIAGAIMILLAAVTTAICACRKRSEALPWICIAIFAGSGALIAALSRVPTLGAIEGGQTRYSTGSLLFVLSTCMLVIIAADGLAKPFRAIAPAVLLALSIGHYRSGYWSFFSEVNRLHVGQSCLVSDLSNTHCLENYLSFPGEADRVRTEWAQLQADGWAKRASQ